MDFKVIRIKGNPDQIEAAVDALCDDDRATLQTNVSRIKRKLVDKVGRLAADQYAIVRGRDGVWHPGAKISEISSRIPDIDIKEIRKMVYSMVDEDIYSEGAKTNRIYYLNSGRK